MASKKDQFLALRNLKNAMAKVPPELRNGLYYQFYTQIDFKYVDLDFEFRDADCPYL